MSLGEESPHPSLLLRKVRKKLLGSMAVSVSATKVVVSLLLLSMIIGSMNVEATWCVARSSASYDQLKAGMDFACSHGADCGPIGPGGSCFNPNTIQNHASYAFDSYYQRNGKSRILCNFRGAATITDTDPSYGGCRYPSFSSIEEGLDATNKTNKEN